jgi:hypothetical protein
MEDVTGNSPSVMKYIKFSDAQHAEVADQDTLRSCVVSEDGANIILTRTDTSIGSTFANELTRHIIYYIGEVKPEVYSEYLISSTRGSYVFGYRAREKFVLLQSEGQILAPFIGFKQHIGGGPGIPMYINNNLQTDFYKNIESGDTVTLKEYFLTIGNEYRLTMKFSIHQKSGSNYSLNRWPQKLASCFFFAVLMFACSKDSSVPPPDVPGPPVDTANAAIKWADITLYTVRFSAFNSPTYASRSLGYLGLAMYESVVPSDALHQSLSGQLNGLTLSSPEKDKPYDWVLSLNAAQDTLLKLLYPVPANSHRFIHERIDSLSNAIYAERSNGLDAATVDRSVQFGRSIALAIYDWSVTDGGDKGYTRNFDPSYIFPTGESYWVPPQNAQTVSSYPLHPHWGENRTFVAANGALPIPAIVPFSSDPASEYYKMYKAVYDKDPLLTLEEREIAAWWADDPTETFSPPGHSYYIASILNRKSGADIMKSAEAYARTGLAIADAFIHCWKAKTTYFNERPSSFVQKYIDPGWIQYWPEPPFPAFPSGHSIQSAAAATVLTEIFGDSFEFTDDSHEGDRRRGGARFEDLRYPARHYNSIWESAYECGYSRILGGIHTRQDNDVGREEGQKIGANVNALHWLL